MSFDDLVTIFDYKRAQYRLNGLLNHISKNGLHGRDVCYTEWSVVYHNKKREIEVIIATKRRIEETKLKELATFNLNCIPCIESVFYANDEEEMILFLGDWLSVNFKTEVGNG